MSNLTMFFSKNNTKFKIFNNKIINIIKLKVNIYLFNKKNHNKNIIKKCRRIMWSCKMNVNITLLGPKSNYLVQVHINKITEKTLKIL